MARNLLHLRGLGPLLLSPWPLRLTRLAGLAVLLSMAAWGWHHHAIPGVPARDPLMYTNLATYGFWVLWLMGIAFVGLFFGRAWCAVCPVGWLNERVARLGLKRPLPSWLGNFVPVTLTLFALQLAVYFLAIHRFPDYTAVLLALMLVLAVAAGLIFRKRAFCHLFCPAGALFGLYARLAPLHLRVSDAGRCRDCAEQSCIAEGRTWRRFALGRGVVYWHDQRPGCPVSLVPSRLTAGDPCTLCLQCARDCSHDNLTLERRPWLAGLVRAPLAPTEVLFAVVLLGMLTANFAKVHVGLREAIFWLPEQLALALGWQAGGFYLLAAPWTALGLPLLLLLPGYLAWRAAEVRIDALPPGETPLLPAAPENGLAEGGWARLGRLALPLLPLILGAHLILALVKLNAKGGYLPLVLGDPTGVKSHLALNVMKTLTAPGVLVPLDVLKWLLLLLLFGAVALSVLAARRTAPSGGQEASARGYLVGALTSISLLGSLYGATLVRWLFIR